MTANRYAPQYRPRIGLALHIHRATKKAIKVSQGGDERNGVWLPKRALRSAADMDRSPFAVIEVPHELARRKGLA